MKYVEAIKAAMTIDNCLKASAFFWGIGLGLLLFTGLFSPTSVRGGSCNFTENQQQTRQLVELDMLNRCYSQCNKFVVYNANSSLPMSYDYVVMCNMICDMVKKEVSE